MEELKMSKKILAIVIALMMVLALASCTPEEEPAKTAAPTVAPAQTTAPATAAPVEPYYIGMYTALTGAGASTGDQQVKGAKVAVDEINAAGGIQGRPIELIVYDDATTPEGAVKAVTRLIEEDKVDVIAGGYLSPNIIATYPQTEAAKVLQVGVGTGTTWTNIGNKYLFRATTNAKLPNATFVKKMVEMGEKTTALISLESEYGQSGRTNVIELLETTTDIELLAEATYQSTETDFTGHISKLMAPNPDSIIMYGNGYEMALIIKQLRQQGFTKNVYTCEGGANTDILQVAGPAANGLIFGCAYVVPQSIEAATGEKESAYLKHFVEMFGEMPLSDVSYRGYDQLHLIGLALNSSTDYTDRDANAEAFRAIKGYEGLAGVFDFTDGTGDGLSGSNAYMILDQQIQVFDKTAMDAWKAAQ